MSYKEKAQQVLSFSCSLMFLTTKKCDHGGVRTPNPQSRNLIFYPVELRGHLFRLLDF